MGDLPPSTALIRSLSLATKQPPPSAYKAPLPADMVGQIRFQYLEEVCRKAPSSLGKPKEFAKLQENPARALHCNRPPDATSTVPATLLHPVFGQFLDNVNTHEPTTEDNALVLELSSTMSKFYPDELK